jgi:cyclase
MKRKMFYGADKIIFENAKALRNNLTANEMILWGRLKEYFPGHKFRRQHPISNYIVDFYCHKLKLIIEVDGSIHCSAENQKLDEIRQKNLEKLGLIVFRFTNEDVRNKIENVLRKINEFIKSEAY